MSQRFEIIYLHNGKMLRLSNAEATSKSTVRGVEALEFLSDFFTFNT
jgi:hypothetical protein